MAEVERENCDDAGTFFERMLYLHVEQALNVQDLTIEMFSTLSGSAYAASILRSPEVWRPFMPPLYNFIFTCIEVFLERYFIESYHRPDGRAYYSTEEWIADLPNFNASIIWPTKEAEKCINRQFSFQRLRSVDVLYAAALKGPLSAYPRFDLVTLMFDKRHLFTHRAASSTAGSWRSTTRFMLRIPKGCLPPRPWARVPSWSPRGLGIRCRRPGPS